jgi:hypothetical protein
MKQMGRTDQQERRLAAQARRWPPRPRAIDQGATARRRRETRAGQGQGSALNGPSPDARGASGSRRDRAAWRSAAADPHNAGTREHRARTPDASTPPSSRRANRSSSLRAPDLRPPAPRPWAPRARTRPRARASGHARPAGHGRSAGSSPAAASSPRDALATPAARTPARACRRATPASAPARCARRSAAARRSCAKGRAQDIAAQTLQPRPIVR